MQTFADSVAWSFARTVGLMWLAFGVATLIYPDLARDSAAPEGVASVRALAAVILASGLSFVLPLSLLSRTRIRWFATAWFSGLFALSLVALARAAASEVGLVERVGVWLLALLGFIGPPMGMLWLLHGWRLFQGQAHGRRLTSGCS